MIRGTLTFPDGSKYVGEVKNGELWRGTKYDKNGDIIAKFVYGEEKRPVVEKKVVEKKRYVSAEKNLTKSRKRKNAQKSNETPNYYIDPFTGFAIDLNKLQKSYKKKECMEVAKLLPADDRLEYLRSCGVID